MKEQMKSPFDVCKRCGRRRKEAGALIPYKDVFICDLCVLENNKNVLREFGELSVAEASPGELERRSDESISPAFEDDEEDEEEVALYYSPLQSLDPDRIDNLLKTGENIPRIEDLSREEIDPEAVSLIPKAIAEQFCLIPIRKEGRSLIVAFSDPNDEEALQELKYFTSLDISIKAADPIDVEEAIEKYYKDEY